MKKTYINPTTEIVMLNIGQNLLIGSPASFDDLGGGEITLEPTIELGTDPGDEVLGRDFGEVIDFDNF